MNNWDLVDLSAGPIVGGYLLDEDREVLDRLARSESVWERRIAMVATHTSSGSVMRPTRTGSPNSSCTTATT